MDTTVLVCAIGLTCAWASWNFVFLLSYKSTTNIPLSGVQIGLFTVALVALINNVLTLIWQSEPHTVTQPDIPLPQYLNAIFMAIFFGLLLTIATGWSVTSSTMQSDDLCRVFVYALTTGVLRMLRVGFIDAPFPLYSEALLHCIMFRCCISSIALNERLLLFVMFLLNGEGVVPESTRFLKQYALFRQLLYLYAMFFMTYIVVCMWIVTNFASFTSLFLVENALTFAIMSYFLYRFLPKDDCQYINQMNVTSERLLRRLFAQAYRLVSDMELDDIVSEQYALERTALLHQFPFKPTYSQGQTVLVQNPPSISTNGVVQQNNLLVGKKCLSEHV